MRRVTFNGQAALPLPDGSAVVGDSDESESVISLRRVHDPEDADTTAVWESESLELGPDPSRVHMTSSTVDVVALWWSSVSVLVVLGYPKAVVVDGETGAVRATFSCEFVAKSSLEQVGLTTTPDSRHLVVTSSKRLWVIDRSLEPVVRYEPRYLLAGQPKVDDQRLEILEYDFDAGEELVTQVIDLPD